MSQGSRPDRLGDQLRVELGGLLTREVKDPGVGFVTITRVRVSADLGVARVYYTCLGSAVEQERSAAALQRAAPFLRRQIAGRVRLKRVPELHFQYDESVERQDRVERVLHDLEVERAREADHDDDPAE